MLTTAESAPGPVAAKPARARKSSAKKTANVWSRNLHSWSSMISMLLILFFAVTGLTLNHPEWTGSTQTTTTHGTLPATTVAGDTVDYLAISEYLRSHEGVTGTAGDHGVEGSQGRIAWAGPSYEATVFFSTEDGTYTLTKNTYGVIAWLNDLHKGRNTSAEWGWVLDASAVALTLVALTGLVLQLVIQRRRRTALVLLGLGILGALAAFWFA